MAAKVYICSCPRYSLLRSRRDTLLYIVSLQLLYSNFENTIYTPRPGCLPPIPVLLLHRGSNRHISAFTSAPTTTIRKTKKSKQLKKAPSNCKKSPAKSVSEPADIPAPKIDPSTGLPNGYSAAKPGKPQALLDERDSFAEYTSQILDPNESLVMHGRLAKIQEEVKKWNRGVRLQEISDDVAELTNEVGDMDDEELAEAEERVAALRKEIEDFERRVAELKADAEKEGAEGEDDDSLYGKDAPEGKDMGPDGDSDNSDEKEKYHKATNAMGQGKKRKRGAN